MDEMSAFEQQIAGELGQMAGPGRRIDATVMVATVRTPSSRWTAITRPLRGGISPIPRERGFSMFSALKFIAASAIVALFGGFLLSGVLMTQQGDQVVPGAVTESPSPMTAQMLGDMSVEGWNNNDLALLERAYAPGAVHTGVYFDGMAIADGRDAVIDAAMGPTSVTTIAPIVELEAPDGELHWVAFGNLSGPRTAVGGVVCNFWARDGQIVRHDCMLPMACLSGVCTR